MDRVTVRELRVLVDRINTSGAHLLEGGEWVDGIPEHLKETRYRLPFFGLEEGSATYGRAFRLYASGGSKYQTAHYDPLHLGSGYLGSTKREAYLALRGIVSALEAKRG
jgi:hypothetical protein